MINRDSLKGYAKCEVVVLFNWDGGCIIKPCSDLGIMETVSVCLRCSKVHYKNIRVPCCLLHACELTEFNKRVKPVLTCLSVDSAVS
jgi:hypothetical protein